MFRMNKDYKDYITKIANKLNTTLVYSIDINEINKHLDNIYSIDKDTSSNYKKSINDIVNSSYNIISLFLLDDNIIDELKIKQKYIHGEINVILQYDDDYEIRKIAEDFVTKNIKIDIIVTLTNIIENLIDRI